MIDLDMKKFIDTRFSISSNSLSFTNCQDIAINGLTKWIDEPFDANRNYAVLKGAAGTGKSFTLKYILNQIRYSKDSIAISAPTHKATQIAANATGLKSRAKTIQSICGLRPEYDISTLDHNKLKFAVKGRVSIGEYNLLVIDESSMINSFLRKYILNKASAKETKVLFVGDGCQLPPVGEKYSTCLFGKIVYTLNEVVRQNEENPISDLLMLARNCIETQDRRYITLLIKRLLQDKTNIIDDLGYSITDDNDYIAQLYRAFESDEFAKDINKYKLASYTNDSVISYNKHIRYKTIAKSADILCIDDLLMSYTTIVNEFNSPIITNSEEYIIREIIPSQVKHEKVILKGYYVKLQEVSTGKFTKPIFIINHLDTQTKDNYYGIVNTLINKAQTAKNDANIKWKKFFDFKDNYLTLVDWYDANGKLLVGKTMDYGFALTVHKTQGSTYNNIFVDAKNIIYNKHGQLYSDLDFVNRLLYVALSRCTNKAIIRLK